MNWWPRQPFAEARWLKLLSPHPLSFPSQVNASPISLAQPFFPPPPRTESTRTQLGQRIIYLQFYFFGVRCRLEFTIKPLRCSRSFRSSPLYSEGRSGLYVVPAFPQRRSPTVSRDWDTPSFCMCWNLTTYSSDPAPGKKKRRKKNLLSRLWAGKDC